MFQFGFWQLPWSSQEMYKYMQIKVLTSQDCFRPFSHLVWSCNCVGRYSSWNSTWKYITVSLGLQQPARCLKSQTLLKWLSTHTHMHSQRSPRSELVDEGQWTELGAVGSPHAWLWWWHFTDDTIIGSGDRTESYSPFQVELMVQQGDRR